MKKNLFSIVLLILVSFSYSQTVTFEYDAAGNQIKREYCGTCQSRTSNVKEYKDITEVDLQKFFPEDIISYYPNPVMDELYLEWKIINNIKVSSVDIYNINGQLVKNIINLNDNNTIVSFQGFTSGTYLVNLNFTSGEQKSITIIKN